MGMDDIINIPLPTIHSKSLEWHAYMKEFAPSEGANSFM